jgi:hypothetical protein
MEVVFADQLVWDDATEGEMEESLSDTMPIRDRILALDGDARTLVILYGKDAHLAVGGDCATGLVVYATFDNQVFHQLSTGEEDGEQEVTVVAGGQPGQYPARHVVQVDDAVAAAQAFAADGRLLDCLVWTGR